jgi:uncharacterized protein YjbI with pentapeptide repeats
VRGLTVLFVVCLLVGGTAGLVIAHAHGPGPKRSESPAALPTPEPSPATVDPDALVQPLTPLGNHPVAGPDVLVLHAGSMQTLASGTRARVELDKVAAALVGVATDKVRIATRTKIVDFVAKWPGAARASLTVDGVPSGSAPFATASPTFDATHATLQFVATGIDAATGKWLAAENGAKDVTLYLDVTPDCPAQPAASCAYASLGGRHLERHDFANFDLYRAQFTASDLAGANFSGAWIGGADFSFATAPGARFIGMDPQLDTTTEARFDGAVLTPGVTFSGNLQGTSFDGARLNGATLTAASLASAGFVAADLANADLSNADLRNATFEDADLTNANLSGANLAGAHFENAILRGAKLTSADLSNATFAHADLTNATLVDASLRGTQLPDANLAGAHLAGATMFGADLWHTSFLGADIGELTTATSALGSEWAGAATYFPTVLDMAGYTCGTQRPDGSLDFADCQYEPGVFSAVEGNAAASVNVKQADLDKQTNAALREEMKALLHE